MKRFDALEVAIETLRVARPVFEAIRKHDRDLEDQALRAAKSVALNVAEGGRRVGRDRTHHFTIAAGSADELAAALRVAEALGYVEPADIAQALGLVDREQAMLTRLRGR